MGEGKIQLSVDVSQCIIGCCALLYSVYLVSDLEHFLFSRELFN